MIIDEIFFKYSLFVLLVDPHTERTSEPPKPQSYITVKNMWRKIQYPHIYKWNLNSQKNVMSALFLMTSCHQDEMTLFASQHFSQLGQILPSFGSYGCTCTIHLKSNNSDRVWCQGISMYTRWFPPYKTARLAFRLILGHNLDIRVPKGEKISAVHLVHTVFQRANTAVHHFVNLPVSWSGFLQRLLFLFRHLLMKHTVHDESTAL